MWGTLRLATHTWNTCKLELPSTSNYIQKCNIHNILEQIIGYY